MNNYLPSYKDELATYAEDKTIGIKEKYKSLDVMRNILTDLRDEINDLKINNDHDPVVNIVIDKIIRRNKEITNKINEILKV